MSRASLKRLRAFAFDPKAQRLNVRAYAGGPLIAVADVRALLERAGAAERHVRLLCGLVVGTSAEDESPYTDAVAWLQSLAPRATKDATLCGAGRKAKRR